MILEGVNQTRATLLLRLRDQGDSRAWEEFVEIYTPLLFAYCQKREISHADIFDIVQDVMRSVARAMPAFEYDPSRGAFKAWLFTVLRHAIAGHYRKATKLPLSSAETHLLEQFSEETNETQKLRWEHDYQLHLMRWGLEQIRDEFHERIFVVFERTALHEEDPNIVAADLGMSVNAIAVAKHRVLKRLREKVASVDSDEWEKDFIST